MSKESLNVKVNPKLLSWARDKLKLSTEGAAKKLKIKEARLIDLEAGDGLIKQAWLVRMAKTYRQATAVFYLREPPSESEYLKPMDFRKLPKRLSSEQKEEEVYLEFLIRDMLVGQGLLSNALADDKDIKPHADINSIERSDGVETATKRLKKILHFDLETFRLSADEKVAFKYLRGLVEQLGVFVLLESNLGSYHTKIEVKVFRGFVLVDSFAPFIVINEQDSPSAQSFTLLHEFTHLLLGKSSLSGRFADQETEKFCNDVAGEVLFPQTELSNLSDINFSDVTRVHEITRELASAKNISQLMVVYKLFRDGKLSKNIWKHFETKLTGYKEKKLKPKGGGPDYYKVKRYKLGKQIIGVVRSLMQSGEISSTKAALILRMNPGKINLLYEKKLKATKKPS